MRGRLYLFVEGGLCVEPGHDLVKVYKEAEFRVEGVVVLFVLHAVSAQVCRDDVQV